MKKGKGIINTLSLIFRIFYALGMVAFVASVLGGILGLFFNFSSNPFEMNIDVRASVDLPLSYSLWNGGEFDGISKMVISQGSLVSDHVGYKILDLVSVMLVYGCGVWIFKLLAEIFDSLSLSVQETQYFDIENYYKIRKIGFISLGFHICSLLKSMCVGWLLLDDFMISGKAISYYPDLTHFGELFTGLIILVIAEVYKVGVQLKRESELVI